MSVSSKIDERWLHFIWQNRLYDTLLLEGRPIVVLEVGELNDYDGPDFQMARLLIDGVEWVGAVEIHQRGSEWVAHQHQDDPRYCSVVLHVVTEGAEPVRDSSGGLIPTAEMVVDESVLKHLATIEKPHESRVVRCLPEVASLPREQWQELTELLLPQRLQRKVEALQQCSQTTHINEIFYKSLMRYLGAYQNNAAMEEVANSLPYQYLKKHANDLEALEAMLIGQAGLFNATPADAYEATLQEQYLFFQQKFGLSPISPQLFSYLRLRPPSFPSRMLALVAQLLHREVDLLQAITTLDHSGVYQLLQAAPSPYWQEHIAFGRSTSKQIMGIGKQKATTLIINAIIPLFYFYSQQMNNGKLESSLLQWLYELPPERNKITSIFQEGAVQPSSAADTQALLELYHHYCTPFRCLTCPIAAAYFQFLHR